MLCHNSFMGIPPSFTPVLWLCQGWTMYVCGFIGFSSGDVCILHARHIISHFHSCRVVHCTFFVCFLLLRSYFIFMHVIHLCECCAEELFGRYQWCDKKLCGHFVSCIWILMSENKFVFVKFWKLVVLFLLSYLYGWIWTLTITPINNRSRKTVSK